MNEETRSTAEDPVEKVLRLGSVVDLANHTLLMARDGREIPIDDSAAQNRQPGSPLLGVVLVFRLGSEDHPHRMRIAAISSLADWCRGASSRRTPSTHGSRSLPSPSRPP